jgi:hypothetical protein
VRPLQQGYQVERPSPAYPSCCHCDACPPPSSTSMIWAEEFPQWVGLRHDPQDLGYHGWDDDGLGSVKEEILEDRPSFSESDELGLECKTSCHRYVDRGTELRIEGEN